MATGASTADVAVVLVDARKGLLTQTRRHSYIVALLGIRQVVLAVNKMDLVGYDQGASKTSPATYRELAKPRSASTQVRAIPISGLAGDNVIARSPATPWYSGPPLLEHLETVAIERDESDAPFRMPVQWVCRPDQDFRGYAGTDREPAASPSATRVVVTAVGPSHARVATIAVGDGDCARDRRSRPVGHAVARPMKSTSAAATCSRPPHRPAPVADQFAAQLLWMHDAPLLPGRRYLLKTGARTVNAQVTAIKHKVDVNTQEHPGGDTSGAERGRLQCNLSLDQDHRIRAFRREPRARQFHPDRPQHQRHRRDAGTHRVRIASRQQHALAGIGRGQAGARRDQGPEAALPVVYRDCPVRASRRSPTWSRNACWRAATTPTCSTATTCATGSIKRPWLQRRGPCREHPSRRRSGEADGRRRPDRPGLLHLAVPRRAPHGARADSPTASSSKCSSTRRWRCASSAT
jgi:hypothetical protein